MTLNPDVVRARCAEIEESVQRLEALAATPLSDFLTDRDAQDIASYRLLVAIEAALALCYHVSSRRLRTTPADYAGCFALLEKRVSSHPISRRGCGAWRSSAISSFTCTGRSTTGGCMPRCRRIWATSGRSRQRSSRCCEGEYAPTWSGDSDILPVVAFDTHAAVKTLTEAGADEALAVAVVEVAREASTEATGELVTRAHFDTALAQLESRLAWRLVTAGIAIAAVVVAALRFLG